jgi:hypothetical protein
VQKHWPVNIHLQVHVLQSFGDCPACSTYRQAERQAEHTPCQASPLRYNPCSDALLLIALPGWHPQQQTHASHEAHTPTASHWSTTLLHPTNKECSKAPPSCTTVIASLLETWGTETWYTCVPQHHTQTLSNLGGDSNLGNTRSLALLHTLLASQTAIQRSDSTRARHCGQLLELEPREVT